MSDMANGPGWWLASDGKWYPPHLHPTHGQTWPQVPQAEATVAMPVPEQSSDLPSFATGFTSGSPNFTAPVTEPSRAKKRRRPLVIAAASIVVLALVGSAVVDSQGSGSTADAAIVHAVNTAIARKTADVSETGSAVAAGHTVSFSGSGEVDFATSAISLNIGLAEAGQQIDEQALYIGGMVYEQTPGISEVAPGKSWVSIDLSSLAQEASQGGTGLGGNPLAMLRALALQGNTVTDQGMTSFNSQSVHGYSVTFNPSVIENEMHNANLPAWMQQTLSQVKVSQGSQEVYVDGAGNLAGASYAITESVESAGTVNVSESLAFSNYGTPVSVTAPPADQVIPFTDFLKMAG
jgi:hypothetical protein